MRIQVEYEPVNPLLNKHFFEQYLSAALTRIFRRKWPVTPSGNPYIENLQILIDRIIEFNAKFIRDITGLRHARVFQLILKMIKYAPFQGRGWQPLPEFLSNNITIIKMKNDDKRCFGYAILYFLEKEQLPETNYNCNRVYLYINDMF